MKKVVTIGVTSGIAAYKIIDLIKLLKKDGHEVYIIMTQSAAKMFSPVDFEKASGNKVFINLFEKDFDYKKILKSRKVDHIDLADKTDLLLIAPATANIIGKLAHGFADDFLTTTALAVTSPIIICPSMNVNMWNNPVVQENVNQLKSAGHHIIGPSVGSLACGYEGAGRLENVEIINKEINKLLNKTNSLKGKKIIITSGGTVEKIDEVRSITNRSSGKMGAALAEQCYLRGGDVLLLRSKNSLPSRYLIKEKIFETVEDLFFLVKENIKNTDIFFQVAAVSDFKVERSFKGKIASGKSFNLKLAPQVKIIDQIKKISPKTKLVAFKAEYGLGEKLLIKEGIKKLKESKADFVVVNDVSRSDRGFESDNNEVFVISSNKKVIKVPLASKKEVAEKLLSIVTQ